ncbi:MULTISPECIES: C40 family peptidase [Lactobacillus]|uniref:NlpC/P60 family protein n=1 Tax=Lactobacillus xujianguonis TaxID=2495899 RepID=A0A437SVH8_9LACO|nr:MULTISPECIES: C40 family peptidase [Lactobacillus]RVU70928.1 NlpC/P60 family protein [Lactobacillus xujianguonis]RVU73560.1 NlpC/P60 family protein [Lactobacillus xujianguonis]
MKIKSNFVKATAAAALTIVGVSAVNAATSGTTNHVQAATMQVKINYVPHYGINIWDNYNGGHFTGNRAQHGTTWNVIQTAVDKKGQTWYEIGEGQWIMAKYTVKANSPKAAKVKKAKTNKKSVQATGDAAGIIALAKAEAGKNYVWGAEGPDSFDCSGLVQYVFSQAAGVNLPRTTYAQVKSGTSVSMDNLQPGDLLFWGSATAPYHVGIYLGNNKYIHAATPKQGVVVQTLSSYFYPSVAKRVLN